MVICLFLQATVTQSGQEARVAPRRSCFWRGLSPPATPLVTPAATRAPSTWRTVTTACLVREPRVTSRPLRRVTVPRQPTATTFSVLPPMLHLAVALFLSLCLSSFCHSVTFPPLFISAMEEERNPPLISTCSSSRLCALSLILQACPPLSPALQGPGRY